MSTRSESSPAWLLWLVLVLSSLATSCHFVSAFVTPSHRLPSFTEMITHKYQYRVHNHFDGCGWTCLHAKKAKQSPSTRNQSPTKKNSIVTGPNVKPAASKEDDLQLTIQIIREFHGLDVPDDYDDENHGEILAAKEMSADTEQETTASSTTEEINFDDIRAKLSLPTYMGSLKRIATAFAPAVGQAVLHPKQIESVTVLSLEATRMELGALVCEGGDCVNISIPVVFSKSCQDPRQQSAATEESILNTIHELDKQATVEIEQAEIAEDNFEQIQSDERLHVELQDEGVRPNLPTWWTEAAGDLVMQDECSNVKNLLNDEEFQSEILALAKLQHSQTGVSKDEAKVTQAAVAFVGTSGVLLRANVQYSDEDGDVQNKIVNLPVPFPSGEAITVSAHRLAVLDLVDNI